MEIIIRYFEDGKKFGVKNILIGKKVDVDG
jgi:hypothetical protein